MQLEKKLSSLGGVPLTHGALVSMLNEYRSPNDKIVRLIDEGWLVPIKKGLYAVSPERTMIPISIPLVANLLYGHPMFRWIVRFLIMGLFPSEWWR